MHLLSLEVVMEMEEETEIPLLSFPLPGHMCLVQQQQCVPSNHLWQPPHARVPLSPLVPL
uniref:Uncharacterized protein n=1 Tax=Anguilla anguilla TaxID=7936 RepID=A0A0E9TTN1_ANGAN